MSSYNQRELKVSRSDGGSGIEWVPDRPAINTTRGWKLVETGSYTSSDNAELLAALISEIN